MIKKPGVNVQFERETYNVGGHSSGYLEKTLPVRFDVYVEDINNPEYEKLRVLADIEKYFMNNDCLPNSKGDAVLRGGHVNFSSSQTFGMFEDKPYGKISITMTVVYLQGLFNPYSVYKSTWRPVVYTEPPATVTVSKRLALRDAIVYNLKKIQTADSYNYTIEDRNIGKIERSQENIPAWPFINIKAVSETVDNAANYAWQDRFLHKVMAVEFDCYVKDINGVLLEQEKILADMEDVLLNYYNMPDSDGYQNCQELMLTYNEFIGMESNVPTGLVRIGANVFYVQDKLNPAEVTG
jgi:hypothetical protein